MFLSAAIAFAQGLPTAPTNPAVRTLVDNIFSVIVFPLLVLLFGLTSLLFVWGVVQLIRSGDDSEARQKGQQHVLWGVVGIFIMISAFAIIQVISNTTGELFGG